MKVRVDRTYYVQVPEEGTDAYEAVLQAFLEDSEMCNWYIDLWTDDAIPVDRKYDLQALNMASYLTSQHDVGNYTDLVELYDEDAEEAP